MPETDKAYALLVDLLHGLENRPISSNERADIEIEVESFAKDNHIDRDSVIFRRLSERLSFSYFPTVSYLKNNAVDKKQSLYLDSTISNTTNTTESIKSIDCIFNQEFDFTELSLQPARKDFLYVCSIRRVKSALSTSYRMFMEDARSVKSAHETSVVTGNGGNGNGGEISWTIDNDLNYNLIANNETKNMLILLH